MNIGLVLAGGVAKGAYQAGFLKAINEESNFNVSCISCASIGVFSGYAYSAGKIDKLIDIWNSVHFDSTVDFAGSVWFKHFLKDKVNELMDKEDFLSIPVYTPVCYLPFLHIDYCRMTGGYDKRWYNFMRSAASFPIIAGGIHFFRGQIALDGGLMDNIPVQTILRNERPDVILVLHFDAGYRPRKGYFDYGIPIIDYDISLHNMFRKRSFDFHGDTIKAMVQSGYEYGSEICAELFSGGTGVDELIFFAERRRKKELPIRLNNTTWETWVQRVNEIFYPLIKNCGKKIYDVRSRVHRNKKKN